MDLISFIALLVFLGWVTFHIIAYGLYLIEHLSEIIFYYRERRLARKARANPPQPSLVEEAMSLYDIALLGLSPRIRAEFETPPNTLIESEPTGSLTTRQADPLKGSALWSPGVTSV